jgi:hypothetical protein
MCVSAMRVNNISLQILIQPGPAIVRTVIDWLLYCTVQRIISILCNIRFSDIQFLPPRNCSEITVSYVSNPCPFESSLHNSMVVSTWDKRLTCVRNTTARSKQNEYGEQHSMFSVHHSSKKLKSKKRIDTDYIIELLHYMMLYDHRIFRSLP